MNIMVRVFGEQTNVKIYAAAAQILQRRQDFLPDNCVCMCVCVCVRQIILSLRANYCLHSGVQATNGQYVVISKRSALMNIH